MTVFWRLLFALLLTDFVFQPQKFYDWKIKGAAPKILHAAVFFILACALAYPYFGLAWFKAGNFVLTGIPALILFSVLHYIFDYIFEGNAPGVKISETAKTVWHKIMMLWALFLISPDAGLAEGRNLFPEPWIIAACGVILVSGYATNIIRSYEADFYDLQKNSDDAAYFTTLYRLIMYGLCLMPGFSWIVMCALWLGVSWYAVKNRFFDISGFNLYFGAGFAIVCGLLVRIIIYGGL